MLKERRLWFALAAVSVVAAVVLGAAVGFQLALGWGAVAVFALVMGTWFTDRR